MTTWTLKTRAVNSKALQRKISELVEEAIEESGVLWSSDTHRESFVEVVDEWLEQFADLTGEITQWNVICDLRNNKIADLESGTYTFDITYRQKNCLNTTQLQYEIQDNGEDFVIDFTI